MLTYFAAMYIRNDTFFNIKAVTSKKYDEENPQKLSTFVFIKE